MVTTAMVMAAGLGTRMRPLTDDRPKALIEVAGRPLIDHVLDRLAEAGITRAVINVHAFADQVETHLARRRDLEILVSDERGALMETGGGLRQARPLLGDAPVLVANIDTLWTDDRLIPRLIAAWDGARMDDLLLVVPMGQTVGFDGPGDFFIDDEGRLTHRGDKPTAPLVYMGVHMLDPVRIDAWPRSPHGIFAHWMDYAAVGRLHGVVADGLWMHVGDPAALALAEARLAADYGDSALNSPDDAHRRAGDSVRN
jgi:MurNAc alpha-1-phosphate uridylyltransferase